MLIFMYATMKQMFKLSAAPAGEVEQPELLTYYKPAVNSQ
jgi:hypothetical protein